MKRNAIFSLLLMALTTSSTFSFAAEPLHGEEVIRNKGSDSMYKGAVALARAYLHHNESLALQRKEALKPQIKESYVPLDGVVVDVAAGGSGSGLAALINGHVEIANVSRAIGARETELAFKRTHKELMGMVVAWDAVTIIVHPNNSLSGLTLKQLTSILLHDVNYKKWSDLQATATGCASHEIVGIDRKNSSGTFAFLHTPLLGVGQHTQPPRVMVPTSQDVVQEVAQNPCAIGYISSAYVTDRVKKLCIAPMEGGPCLEPQATLQKEKRYPLLRPLQMVTLAAPAGKVKDYLDWVRSDEGQKILTTEGYYPAKALSE